MEKLAIKAVYLSHYFKGIKILLPYIIYKLGKRTYFCYDLTGDLHLILHLLESVSEATLGCPHPLRSILQKRTIEWPVVWGEKSICTPLGRWAIARPQGRPAGR